MILNRRCKKLFKRTTRISHSLVKELESESLSWSSTRRPRYKWRLSKPATLISGRQSQAPPRVITTPAAAPKPSSISKKVLPDDNRKDRRPSTSSSKVHQDNLKFSKATLGRKWFRCERQTLAYKLKTKCFRSSRSSLQSRCMAPQSHLAQLRCIKRPPRGTENL